MFFRETHGKLFERPTSKEIAAAVPGSEVAGKHHLQVYRILPAGHHLETLPSISPHADPMEFPLLFPFGECGWSPNLQAIYSFRKPNSKQKPKSNRPIDNDEFDAQEAEEANDLKVSMRQFYSSHLAIRREFSLLHSSGRLFQEYAVVQAVKIQNNNLNWLRLNQPRLRLETYQGLSDHLKSKANRHLQQSASAEQVNLGKLVILPSTFVDSPRYLQQKYQDAIAMVREFGNPSLFITFTCNPNWKEITENIPNYQSKSDRFDQICRVFEAKRKEFTQEIVEGEIFGRVAAYSDTVEFQKRGLPHMHMALILDPAFKILTAEQIDRLICAEIPDPVKYPVLHAKVTQFMIHRPCGPSNPTASCMVPAKSGNQATVCSKGFPKEFAKETIVSQTSFSVYRRRSPEDGGFTCKIGSENRKTVVDNRFVVPYNPYLLQRFDAHINVEVVATMGCVKYLYKYLMKGPDSATLQIVATEEPNVSVMNYDEIHQFVSTRYMTPPEGI